jgi:hypothetical protein
VTVADLAADSTYLGLHTYFPHRQGSIQQVRVLVASDTVDQHTGCTRRDSFEVGGQCNRGAVVVHIVEVVLPELPFATTSERQVATLPLAVERQNYSRQQHFLTAGEGGVHHTDCCVDSEVQTLLCYVFVYCRDSQR